ncbi:MAG: outer membrane protein assembly factor [Planctomycetes bacterium]|nr:outer membrane protein assembly factor [Planctomycetota bacterium]
MTPPIAPSRALRLASACVLLAGVADLRAQDPLAPGEALAGRRIAVVDILGVPVERARELAPALYTRVDSTLALDRLNADIVRLWSVHKLVGNWEVEELPSGELRLVLRLEAPEAVDRLTLRGQEALEEAELRRTLGITPGGKALREDAPRLAERLREHYQEQGYAWAEVTPSFASERSELLFEIYEGPRVFVRALRFHGNESFTGSTFLSFGLALEDAMESTPPLLRWPFRFGGALFVPRRIEEDRIALERFYRAQGFRDAEVAIDVQRSADGLWVDLDVHVDEGARYRLRELRLEGIESYPEAELRALLRSRPGEFLLDQNLAEDQQAITSYYGRRGHPLHFGLTDRFDLAIEELHHEDRSITVVMRVHEGRQRKLQRVEVRGNHKTRRDVILRELLIDPGEILDAEKLGRSIARLEALRYFQDERGFPAVDYDLVASAEDPEDVTWVIEVEEDRTGRFQIGGGVSTDVGAFLSFGWSNTNFALSRLPDSALSAVPEMFAGTAFSGDGQSLILQASPGIEVSSYSAAFREPDLFGLQRNPIAFDASIYQTLRLWETHFEQRTGQTVSLSKGLTRELQVGLGLRNDRMDVSQLDPRAFESIQEIEGSSWVRGVGARALYSDLDAPLAPTDGIVLSIEAFWSTEALSSDYDYWNAVLAGYRFFDLHTDERGRSEVLEIGGSIAFAGAYGDTLEVPYFDRYFLGGIDSLRGFDIRGAGPVENGLPRGGEALWTASFEYAFPILSMPEPRRAKELEWMRGFAFVDFGGLGLDWSDPTMREVRSSAGVGLRLRMPFLPSVTLEMSFAYPWLRQETDDLATFQFRLSG